MAIVDSAQLKNKAMGAMSGFSTGQKAVVGLAALALIIGGVFFAQWAGKPTMVPLYSNVSSDDASAITTKLAANNTPYTLTNGGATINVPQKAVYQTRIDLAGDGLPTGGSNGYKLLDNQSITTSDFLQHVNYQRAVEGELDNTIGSIQGVSAATVHLVMPQQDVFANDDKKPTASVLLKLQSGKSLSSGQTQAVVNLVASSVEGLTSDNVTVTDDKGRLLASPGQSAQGSDSSDGDAQTKLENDLTTKITNLLTPVVGAGKVQVATRAELNYDQKEQVSTVYNPNNKALQPSASKTETEVYGNGAAANTDTSSGCLGVGTPTNTVCTGDGTGNTATGGTTTGSDNSYKKVNSSQDNLTDTETTKITSAPGSTSRLSVAVMYDSAVSGVDQAQIEALVSQAAGLQPARGDSITVSPMPFDKSAADSAAKDAKAADSAAKSAQLMGFAKTGATIFMVLIALAVLVFMTKKKAGQYASATPISMNEIDSLMPALPSGSMNELDSIEIDTSPEGLERAKVDKEITSLIEKQPEEVASLLRNWLADRRS